MEKAVLKVAMQPDENEIISIKSGFSKILHKPVDFNIVEDSSLIGGFIAYIDGRIYDASIRTQLENIKSSFTDRRDILG